MASALRWALGGLVVLLGASAPEAQPIPPRPGASSETATPLYQADFFGDARWAEAVRDDVRAQETPDASPPTRTEPRTEPGGGLQPLQRGTIDQNVLQQIIMDRSRRVAMNAVADAISEIVGPVGDRQYLQHLLGDVAALLTDRTGMQNTLVEQFVATLVRAVVADAVVRLRLPGEQILDACAWRRVVYGEEAALDREACDAFPLKSLAGRPAAQACTTESPGIAAESAPRPVACAFLTSTAPPQVWLPSARGRTEATRLRAYLVDLAYWSLGRTELFNRQAPVPTCPFDLNSPHRQLCTLVEGPRQAPRPVGPPAPAPAPAAGAARDGGTAAEPDVSEDTPEDRAAAEARAQEAVASRAAWLSGTADLVGAMQVARDLMALLRPPLNSRLRTLINTVIANPDLGQLGKRALDPNRWDELASFATWVDAWRETTALLTSLETFVSDTSRPPREPAPRPGHGRQPQPAPTSRPGVGVVGPRPAPYSPPPPWGAGDAGAAPRPSPPSRPSPPPPPPQRPSHGDALEHTNTLARLLRYFVWPPNPGPAPTWGANPVLSGFTADGGSGVRPPPCDRAPSSVRAWSDWLLREGLARAAQADPGEPRRTALCIPPWLQSALRPASLQAQAGDLVASFDAVRGAALELRTAAERLRRVLPELQRASLYGTPGFSIASINLDRIAELVRAMQDLATALQRLDQAINREPFASLVVAMPAPQRHAETLRGATRALTGVSRMLRLAGALDAEALRDRGIASVGDAYASLRTLGGPVLARLGPVLSMVPLDRQISIESMLVMLEHMNPEDIVVALGVAPARARWCDQDERSLACWLQRLVAVLREVTDVQDNHVTMDSNRLVRTLGSLGDDFRRRREWRVYFHLTIGLGEMLTLTPRVNAPGVDSAFVPIMAEQLGIGLASPSFGRDRFGFRTGLFGSGLLYRAVLNSRESDAFFFGAFAALDLYELLELFVAPTAIVYAPGDSAAPPLGFGLVLGAQVPLSDYLSRL